MDVVTKDLEITTQGEGDVIDLSDGVEAMIDNSGLSDGIVTIFVSGSTGAVTTIEYEPGLRKDFPGMLERIAPKGMLYEHENTWNDHNGHSHVRASLVGPSLTIPFTNRKLLLGTWQQIVFVECDIRSRNRHLVLQIMGK